jgi:hypothetical protein
MRRPLQKIAALITGLVSSLTFLTEHSLAEDFHNNDWVYISAVHPWGLTLLEGPYKVGPDDPSQFYPFVALSTYPGALSGSAGPLGCLQQDLETEEEPILIQRDQIGKPKFNQSRKFIDEILPRLKTSAQWMVDGGQSFRKIYTYATGPEYSVTNIPLYGPVLSPTGRIVNYVGCQPGLNFMAVNSQLSDSGSHFMTIGEDAQEAVGKPILLDHLPTHELIHVHQNNYAPFKLAGYDVKNTGLSWIMEGTAEAVGMLRAHDAHGGHKAVQRKIGPYSDKFYRRFYMLRNYNIPLNFDQPNSRHYDIEGLALISQIDQRMWNALSYETNGFWFHVIERYLNKDAGHFTDLFGRLTPSGIKNVTRNVDAFLDQHDGMAMRGLEHVYPQFLAEFNNWWDYRSEGRISEKKWMNIAYNGCAFFDLSISTPKDTVSFDVSDYAGKCIDLKISAGAASRLNDVQFVVAGADQTSDEIYLGVSRIEGSRQGTVTCYDIVEQRGARTAPCLVDPHQGFANWKGGTGIAKKTLLRTFNLTDLKGSNGQALEIRLVVVRVPAEHYDVVGKLKRKTLDLTVSLDLAALKPKSKSASKRRSVMNYGARQGEGPVAPDGSTSVMNADLEDALRGHMNRMGAPGAGAMMKQLIGFELIDENETNFSVGFLLSEPLKEGITGPVKVTGIMGERTLDGKKVVSIQNPRNESTLDILEYDEATLRVEGEVNVCAAPLSKLMSEETSDLCRVGEELSFEVEGSVAFPNLVDGATEFTLHRTEAYDAYKDLRMERLALRGLSFGPGSDAPDKAPSPAPPPLSPPSAPDGNPGDTLLCSVFDDRQRCACTCETKACFDQKSTANRLLPREKACRLTCGKKWNQCTP